MKRPSFLHGVLVAAVLGFFASAFVATLTPFVGLGAVLRLVIPALGLAYLLYLLSRSKERVGRITTLSLWGGRHHMVGSSPVALLSADSRRRNLAGALPVFLQWRGAGADGPWARRFEYLRHSLGSHPNRQRVSCHLVFFPDTGPVRHDPTCNKEQTEASKEHGSRERELRARKASGRPGTAPVIHAVRNFTLEHGKRN